MDENQDQQIDKITINGEELDVTEAQELIERGRKTREAEQKYNITFDSIMPAYTKANERAKQAETLEAQLSEARKQIEQFQSKRERGTDTDADLNQAREAAKKIGLLTTEDIQGKFLTKDDITSLLDEREKRSESVRAIRKEAETLETKYNGEDGRPKFNKKVVLAYAQAYGSGSLEEAYTDMHADALQSWQKQQVDAKRNPGLKTLAEQRGNKQPNPVRPNGKNDKDLLEEALFGSRE